MDWRDRSYFLIKNRCGITQDEIEVYSQLRNIRGVKLKVAAEDIIEVVPI